MAQARAAALLALVAAAGLLATAGTVAAEVTSRTAVRTFPIGGRTPAEIVSYFHNHPFPGDRGPALANLRASYSLSLTTKTGKGGACRPANVHLDVSFVITLPKATEEARMSRGTLSLWRQAAGFARNHEYSHRAMDLTCARNFVARAQRVSASSCWEVESTIRRMLQTMQATCEARQAGFDRSEARRAGNLGLFRAARAGRR